MKRLTSECDARLLKASKEHEKALERQLVELTGQAGDICMYMCMYRYMYTDTYVYMYVYICRCTC